LAFAATRDSALRLYSPRSCKRRPRLGRWSGDGRTAEAPSLRSGPLLFLARHLFFSLVSGNKKTHQGQPLAGENGASRPSV